jgi:prophage tail gpP-like protein
MSRKVAQCDTVFSVLFLKIRGKTIYPSIYIYGSICLYRLNVEILIITPEFRLDETRWLMYRHFVYTYQTGDIIAHLSTSTCFMFDHLCE